MLSRLNTVKFPFFFYHGFYLSIGVNWDKKKQVIDKKKSWPPFLLSAHSLPDSVFFASFSEVVKTLSALSSMRCYLSEKR